MKEIAVAIVPPDTLPRTRKDVNDSSIEASGPSADFKVLLDKYTAISDGTESKPQAGIIMASFLFAR